MKTVTTKKALQNYISEILETLEKDQDVWWLIQTKFFEQRILNRSFVASFKRFRNTFKNFRNLSTYKKVVDLRTTGEL